MLVETAKNRVLVVDDSLMNQQMIREILKDSYILSQAITVREALQIIPEFRPHLILLDIILPDGNGFDLLVTLKEMDITRQVPVIILSGLDSAEDEEKGFVLGAVDYIKKPFKDAIVKARVNTQMRIVKQIQTIEQLGLKDALTGISNRRAFDSHIAYEWGRSIRKKTELSLLMLDVDDFKVYNDTYGHPQGDVMLRAVAQTLRTLLHRSVDILCRYGGEEFAALLPETGVAEACPIAERIRAGVEALEVPCGKELTRATVSIGLAAAKPRVGEEYSMLVERADRMMYRAKHAGRNRVECLWDA